VAKTLCEQLSAKEQVHDEYRLEKHYFLRHCGWVRAGFGAALVDATQAADYDIGPIHIAQPWARATPKGASSGAAYMTITNNGKRIASPACRATSAPNVKFTP
jgi:hypothetical protein